jgi:hypothetical protein
MAEQNYRIGPGFKRKYAKILLHISGEKWLISKSQKNIVDLQYNP